MGTVIRVENLSKSYLIRHQQSERYIALRDVMAIGLKNIGRRLISPFNANQSRQADPLNEEFWALKDVSFKIRQGERMGVIGRNGAGKSTLLKLLSRITEPKTGSIYLKGRVSSLLEVGTGFHPELTGRENIFLNGAILGMKKTEIKRKFDDIVDFAEIEKFLDTPVKRYSSGMYVRLAFSVAAHLDTEILLVDEVLAVGDAVFQKKCLGKMDDVATAGRTIIFVSHNMSAVQRLCNRGIMLNEGRIILDGPIDNVIEKYINLNLGHDAEHIWPNITEAPGDDVVRLRAIRTKKHSGEITSFFDVREPVAIEIDYAVLKEGYQLCAVCEFINAMGQVILVAFDDYIYGHWGKQSPCPVGFHRSACLLPGEFFSEGEIFLNLRIFSPPLQPNEDPHVRMLNVIQFTVSDSMDPGGVRGNFPYSWGLPAVRIRLKWLKEFLPVEKTDLLNNNFEYLQNAGYRDMAR